MKGPVRLTFVSVVQTLAFPKTGAYSSRQLPFVGGGKPTPNVHAD
jgi:hypothetical protein